MNERVQQLLDKRRKELESERMDRRNRHLIEIGLCEDANEIIWSKNWNGSPEWEYDEEKDSYYKIRPQKKAISVTDEEYAEICKLFPENRDDDARDAAYTNAEKTLNVIANIVLVVGVIACIIIIITALTALTPAVALVAIPYFILVLAAWAILRCFADISITLKEIKKKMNK